MAFTNASRETGFAFSVDETFAIAAKLVTKNDSCRDRRAMKILILGGYGTFGGRLAHLLAGEERLTLIIAGRSEFKARTFSTHLARGARKVPLAFDRDADVEGQISAAKPGLVIDATGPFQFYGDDPYRVVYRRKVGRDLAGGFGYCEGQTQGLGEEFLSAVNSAFDAIERYPEFLDGSALALQLKLRVW